ncbi:ABC transporter ATP-binding protein [Bacillus sp. APMAM]|nr:ABC transporter ATP-binding protein [Bacillus sp. APMAM]RTZ57241.1 ABC transporter ATP-binding protein [Bacillus sp. SAJ1]
MNSAIVSITNVSKSFGNQQILEDVSLTVGTGEIFGLLGPSGSGKTTLVKMMMGIESINSGNISIAGLEIPSFEAKKIIGYMAQSDALYLDLTAKENLEFFGSLYGLKGKKLKERIQLVMEMVDLQNHLHKTLHQYSGGMKRRLSLAISLLHEPKLLILDEPTVGIDPVLRKSIWGQFQTLTKQGTTIFLTTHVMDEAEKCDRLGLIQNGKLIVNDTPEKMKEMYRVNTLEEIFLAVGGAAHDH